MDNKLLQSLMEDVARVGGNAAAAFTLCQLILAALVQGGLLSKEDVAKRLQAATEANKAAGGPDNLIAATLLAAVSKQVDSFETPTRQ